MARRSDPFRYDRRRLIDLGRPATLVAGADEVGRGCLAGPLVAAAVVLDYSRAPARLLRGLTDSKALSPRARDDLHDRILLVARRVTLAVVSPGTIDRDGLHRSDLAALASCLERLDGDYDLALVDGFDLRRPDLRADRVVGGDWHSAAIAAASVVAKVTRDRLMHRLHDRHPEYGFAAHVGYATSEHRQALEVHGATPLHRRSFAPVAALAQGKLVLKFEGDARG
jgi:ribonuclease HII